MLEGHLVKVLHCGSLPAIIPLNVPRRGRFAYPSNSQQGNDVASQRLSKIAI